jgi:hypothetical protein
MKRSPMKRGKPLVWKGRKSKSRVTKGGRIILNWPEYLHLCKLVWERDQGCCQIRHDGCWGRLPYFSTAWCHHKIHRARGGSDSLENLVCVCPYCHEWIHDNPKEQIGG